MRGKLAHLHGPGLVGPSGLWECGSYGGCSVSVRGLFYPRGEPYLQQWLHLRQGTLPLLCGSFASDHRGKLWLGSVALFGRLVYSGDLLPWGKEVQKLQISNEPSQILTVTSLL